jgi:hypothetical protein
MGISASVLFGEPEKIEPVVSPVLGLGISWA